MVRIQILLFATLIGVLAGCGGPVSSPPPREFAPQIVRPPVPSRAQVILQNARQQLGVRYRYAGISPGSGFDCSGLAWYSHKKAGINIPRRSSDQFRAARRVSLNSLVPGDLIFFRISGAKISHVGIYSGGGRFIHAPSSGKRVSYASLYDRYWKKRVVGAGRYN